MSEPETQPETCPCDSHNVFSARTDRGQWVTILVCTNEECRKLEVHCDHSVMEWDDRGLVLTCTLCGTTEGDNDGMVTIAQVNAAQRSRRQTA